MSKKVSFEEIGCVTATFLAGEGVKKGMAVNVAAEATVNVCTEGSPFCGVVLDTAADGVASVQVGGFATLPVSGEGVAPGWVELTADGLGGVKAVTVQESQSETKSTAEAGRTLLVVSCDETAGTAVVLL